MTAIILNALIVLLELVSCTLSFRKAGAVSLKYYTVLSNIMGLVSSALYVGAVLTNGKLPHWVSVFRYSATVCLTVTFLVVMVVLLPFEIKNGDPARLLYKGANLCHHILCPILALVSLVFFDKLGRIGMKELLIAFSFTVLYAAVLICLNLARLVRGPYHFLHVYEQPLYMSVIWFTVILGSSFGIAQLCRVLVTKFNNG